MTTAKNRTILVIHSDLKILETLVRVLETEGYKSSGITDSHIALKCIRETVPDLVICDFDMSPLDGFSIVNQLRNELDPKMSEIPFIFLAYRDPNEGVINDLSFEIDDFIIKPFFIDELQERIKNVLRQCERLFASGKPQQLPRR